MEPFQTLERGWQSRIKLANHQGLQLLLLSGTAVYIEMSITLEVFESFIDTPPSPQRFVYKYIHWIHQKPSASWLGSDKETAMGLLSRF